MRAIAYSLTLPGIDPLGLDPEVTVWIAAVNTVADGELPLFRSFLKCLFQVGRDETHDGLDGYLV
jgi:hypothetical protein